MNCRRPRSLGIPATSVATWVMATVAGIAVGGCGSRGPERFHLAGKVTFDGKPVPVGSIRFEADHSRSNHGPVGHAAIVSGSYTTRAQGSQGALRGPLIVVIDGGPLPDSKHEPPVMWFTDYRTTITVEPQSNATAFDFDVPAPAKIMPSAAAGR